MHALSSLSCCVWYANASQSPNAAQLHLLKGDAEKALLWQQTLAKQLGLKHCAFLHQTHSIIGHAFDNANLVPLPWSIEGDFLVTNQPLFGLGVLTADCLPVIFCDPGNHAVGIAHAGWQGSVAGVCLAVIERMGSEYGTKLADLAVFFGPCARVCCYEVASDFKERIIAQHPWAQATLQMHQGKIFFNLIEFNKALMMRAGVPATAFKELNPPCTMCDLSYYSYRRQKECAGRNITVVWQK